MHDVVCDGVFVSVPLPDALGVGTTLALCVCVPDAACDTDLV